MATPNSKAVAKQKQDEETALALARPSFIEESTQGTDEIDANEVKLPRLAIAQGLSPQMLPDDGAYIDSLKLFDMFNDLSSEVYGRGPLKFIVCQREVKRIEFEGDERKVPVDLNVPANDPRMFWTKDPETGKGVPPRAVKFVEFIVLLIHDDGRAPEPVVMSIQETNKFNKRAHERLSGFIKMRNPPAPIYAGLYTVTSKSEKNDQGTFGVFWIDNAGYVQDANLYAYAKKFSESLKGKQIVVERQPGEDDGFDPARYETGGTDNSGM